MSAQGGSTTPPLSVSYAQLRAWIDSQEAYERLHGHPAPLTTEQRRAMAAIVPPPLAPPSPPSPASHPVTQPAAQPLQPQPSLPGPPASIVNDRDFDWVSLLSRYDQSQQRHSPGSNPEYEEELISNIEVGKPLWRFRCILPREAPGQLFPSDDEPVIMGAKTRKKDAKQYAARRAIEFLMAHRYMPCDGLSVTFPKGASISSLSALQATPLVQPAKSSPSSPSPPPSPPQIITRTFAPASSSSSSSSLPLPPVAQPVAQPAPETPPSQGKGKQPQTAPMRSASDLTTPKASSSAMAASVETVSPLPNSNGGGGKGKGTVRSMASHRNQYAAKAPSTAASYSSAAQQRYVHNSSSTTNVDDSDSEEETSNEKRLQQLCEAMDIGKPSYIVTRTGSIETIFSGQLMFPSKRNRSLNIPPEVGTVSEVYTKKATREKMAGNALDYFKMIAMKGAEA